MRQIIDGVFELRLGFVNVHLAVIDDGVVLIDTGLPGRRAALRIESALHDVHRTVGAVTHILLTHKHPDHTGGVAELRRRSGARVVAHEAAAPVDATSAARSNAERCAGSLVRDVSTTSLSRLGSDRAQRRPMWSRGHAFDSAPFASAAAISDGIAVVSQGTLTPLLRRESLVGSGSEECQPA